MDTTRVPTPCASSRSRAASAISTSDPWRSGSPAACPWPRPAHRRPGR
jgi:hypothetical protein